MNVIRTVYGLSGVLLTVATAIVVLVLGVSSVKGVSYQYQAQQCQEIKVATRNECVELIKFGVDPAQFLTDEAYRNDVTKMYIRAVELNAYIAPKVAQFTLDNAFRKRIVIVADVLAKLQSLSQEAEA